MPSEKPLDDRLAGRTGGGCHTIIAWVLLAGLTLSTSGCSTFNRDWKRAAASAAPANDVTGPWQGEWVSAVNGHRGALRCLVTRIEDTRYHARYRATYWRWFRFRYAVNMNVVRGPEGAFLLEGEEDLGWLAGGVYHYTGEATPSRFVCTYESKHDRGTFEMTRLR